MSWNPRNCYNIVQRKPLNERHLNLFQLEWKSKALCRLYFNGDVTERVFKQVYNANNRNIYDALGAMERRVDNMLFRCMFAPSVFHARRMASTGQVAVNGTRVMRPGQQLKDGDVLQVYPEYAPNVYKLMSHPMIRLWAFIPAYVEVNFASLSAILLRKPKFEEIPSPYPRYMVENTAAFYSKRG